MTTPTETDGTLPAEQSAAAGPGSLEAELARGAGHAPHEHWNSYLRAVAETDNVRKRAQRDVEAASRYAIERFAGELLEVRDSLELGLAAGAGRRRRRACSRAWRPPCACSTRPSRSPAWQLVDPVGQPFNPEFHEAMATQPTRRPAARHGAGGGPEGLPAQRPAAASGPGARRPRSRTRPRELT